MLSAGSLSLSLFCSLVRSSRRHRPWRTSEMELRFARAGPTRTELGPRAPLRVHGPLSQIEIAIFNENSFESALCTRLSDSQERATIYQWIFNIRNDRGSGPEGARRGPAADKSLSGRARYPGGSMAATMAVYLLFIFIRLRIPPLPLRCPLPLSRVPLEPDRDRDLFAVRGSQIVP